jgi:hypothetical protein
VSFVGYDPARIDALSYRARWAIDDLRRITSDEPLADGAIDEVRRTVRTLEEQWMPLISAIEQSSAMTRFGVVGRSFDIGVPNRRFFVASDTRYASMSDADLLDVTRDRGSPVRIPSFPEGDPDIDGYVGRPIELGADDAALGREIAARMLTDRTFAREILDEIATNPAIALWLPTDLPDQTRVDIAERLARAMSTALTMSTVYDATSVLDRLLPTYLDHAELCVALMRSPSVRDVLSGYPALDQDAVAAIAERGLVYPLVALPERIGEGQRLLREVIEMAAAVDELGEGFTAGVAASMVVYAPTFVPSIGGPAVGVFAADSYADPTSTTPLGSYEEMLTFLGALLRRPEGQAALGVTVADLSATAVAGDRLVTVDAVAEFGNLLAVAAQREDRAYELEAAATQAAIGNVTTLVGGGASLAVGASGVGAFATGVVGPLVNGIGKWVASQVETRTTGAPPFLAVTRTTLRIAAIRHLATDASARAEAGLASADDAIWDEMATALDRLGDLDQPDIVERSAHVLHDAERTIRLLGGGDYLDDIVNTPATHDLTRPLPD